MYLCTCGHVTDGLESDGLAMCLTASYPTTLGGSSSSSSSIVIIILLRVALEHDSQNLEPSFFSTALFPGEQSGASA